jgi:hypothetical protein
MNRAMSAFYPGAGDDLAPPVLFPEIKHWTYLDSQPNSEYGHTIIARPLFLSRLDRVMSQCGFMIQSVQGDLRIYRKEETDQVIRYETNSVFPDAWDPVRHAADALVCCGFDLDDLVPSGFFAAYPHIITNSITCDNTWKRNRLPHHRVSILNYNKTDWEYWNVEQETTEHFKKNICIKHLNPTLL